VLRQCDDIACSSHENFIIPLFKPVNNTQFQNNTSHTML
jgi:hypothetical protein